MSKADFLDLGCGDGGSLKYCETRFFAKGIGVEKNPVKIEAARERGLVVEAVDLSSSKLPWSDGAFRFVSALDFFEHLPSVEMSLDLLKKTARLARDFLFIRHPSFEDEQRLARHGIKLTWTDWKGHRAHIRLSEFRSVFRELGATRVEIVPRGRIVDSSSNFILPIDAPIDQLSYDQNEHGPKPYRIFIKPLYSQFDIFVALREWKDQEWEELITPSRQKPKLWNRLMRSHG